MTSHKPLKYIVTEHFTGKQNSAELFSDLVLLEIKRKGWTTKRNDYTIKSPTVKSNLCCSRKE